MGFLKRFLGFFSKKENEATEDINIDAQSPGSESSVSKEQKVVRKKYRKVPVTRETAQYVQSMVKKAYTQEKKSAPVNILPDPKQIEKITSKLKEDLAKRK